MNLSAIKVWILSRAVGQSNVSKEASNHSQKSVLGCNNTVEIPACVRKYIIDLCPEADLKHVYTHFTDQ
ncbi:hypothetical protein L596_029092 [Steinernema carpocapsae]|uniref:Uncharacterized protein n=1 Tax=Steinernema carpocapsae TaxID=34508 RepID=A0A4U5LTL9_STECR|nr:hypothetical protein L596_029092 [Steinernema carpocapsae]